MVGDGESCDSEFHSVPIWMSEQTIAALQSELDRPEFHESVDALHEIRHDSVFGCLGDCFARESSMWCGDRVKESQIV